MKRKLIFSLILAVLITAFAMVTALGDPSFRLFVNGEEIIYAEGTPQPLIINNRALLPAAATMEKLGVELDMNTETGSLVMKKDGNTAAHTLYSDVLAVNGVSKEYPASSLLINGEAFIPVVMVADVIGYESAWDDELRAVVMDRMIGEGSGSIPGDDYDEYYDDYYDFDEYDEYYEEYYDEYDDDYFYYEEFDYEDSDTPEVISYTTNKESISLGEEFIVNVMTNEPAESVRLVDTEGNVLAESARFVPNSGVNSFTLRYTPINAPTSLNHYYIQAGGAHGFNSVAARGVYVTITPGRNYVYTSQPIRRTTAPVPSTPPSIKSIRFTNKTYSVRDSVNVTIVTSRSVTRLEVYDKSTRTTKRYSRYTDAGSTRTFKIAVSPTISGANGYTVYAYNNANRYASRSFTISASSPVTYRRPMTSTYYRYPTAPTSVYCWEYPYYWAYPYYYCDWNWRGSHILSFAGPYNYGTSYGFYVYTSVSVNNVQAVDYNGRVYSGSFSREGGRNRWSFTIPYNVGGVLVTAYGPNGRSIESRWISNITTGPGYYDPTRPQPPVYNYMTAAEARRKLESSSPYLTLRIPINTPPGEIQSRINTLLVNAVSDPSLTLRQTYTVPDIYTLLPDYRSYSIGATLTDYYGRTEIFYVNVIFDIYDPNPAPIPNPFYEDPVLDNFDF